MRTKLTMLTLVLLGVLSSREAQAFYNPSTGRWLSRDPLTDAGVLAQDYKSTLALKPKARSGKVFANIYCFVLNDSILNSDKLGLDLNIVTTASSAVTSSCCKCGPSVDWMVAAALVNMTQTFLAATPKDQRTACDNLQLKNLTAAIDAWDMSVVQTGVPAVVQGQLCNWCSTKVTFRGGCYDPGDVNYMMFGHIASLCEQELDRDWNSSSVEQQVLNAKSGRNLPVGCAAAFAVSGYDGRPVVCPWGDSKGACAPQKGSFRGNRKNWVWEPIQKRN